MRRALSTFAKRRLKRGGKKGMAGKASCASAQLGCKLPWMDGDDQVGALSVFGPPSPVDDPAFDVRAFFDPWAPRRALNALQRARIASGLTQAEVAAELGVSRHTVSSMENRRHIPSVRLALAVATLLHETVEDLFAADDLG